MSRLRVCLYALLLCLMAFGLARIYYRLTDDFRLSNITYEIPYNPAWDVSKLSQEEEQDLHAILKQKFFYIGKGAQCYAFTSEDQKYVLKFFKFKHLKPNWLVHLIPSIPPFKQMKELSIERKKKKLHSVFEGYALAYRENREDSELLYLHLMPTRHLNQLVTVVDKIGLERKINLDDVVFLIQKKGETLRMRMHEYLAHQQVEKAKEAIAKIFAMYMSEYRKGLYDRDHGVMHNTGFVEDRPFHLDVGKFTKDEAMKLIQTYKQDLEHIAWKIDTWVRQSYPQYHAIFSLYLSDQYYQQTGIHLDITSIDPLKYKKKKR